MYARSDGQVAIRRRFRGAYRMHWYLYPGLHHGRFHFANTTTRPVGAPSVQSRCPIPLLQDLRVYE